MAAELFVIIIFVIIISFGCFILMEGECCQCGENEKQPMSENENIEL